MALTNCPECGKQVSTSAQTCASCGFPIAAQASKDAKPRADTLLAEVRTSWWRFFWHLVFFWLIVPLVIAWWRRGSVVLRVYPGRIMLERGRLTKSYREFSANDIRSLDIEQGMLARLVDIGDLTISTAATVDAAEVIQGVPHPQKLRELIISQRQV
jgi:uncharacterized membrane protein YdbT with pleckstrin-like domain